jgi:cytochrome c oxidase subunit II
MLPRILVVAATPPLLAGCAGPLSTLSPAGPVAGSLAALWWIMFWGATALFMLVMVLLALTYLRPQVLRRLSPTGWIVGGGLLLTVPVLIVLTAASLVLGEQLLPRPDGETRRVELVAERWAWHFSYPEAGTGSTDVLHIPAGEPVEVVVRSADVIHSFWIPTLGGKMDAIPGHTNVIELRADRPGRYQGICAEYCGTGHDFMHFTVEAHPAAAYQAVLQALR